MPRWPALQRGSAKLWEFASRGALRLWPSHTQRWSAAPHCHAPAPVTARTLPPALVCPLSWAHHLPLTPNLQQQSTCSAVQCSAACVVDLSPTDTLLVELLPSGRRRRRERQNALQPFKQSNELWLRRLKPSAKQQLRRRLPRRRLSPSFCGTLSRQPLPPKQKLRKRQRQQQRRRQRRQRRRQVMLTVVPLTAKMVMTTRRVKARRKRRRRGMGGTFKWWWTQC